MRHATRLVVGVALLSLCGAAAAEERQPASYPDDGMNWRERLAVNYMTKRLRKVYPSRQYKVSVTPTLVQYPGNKQRPVTAQRPVAVDARIVKKDGSSLSRVLHRMSSKSRSRFYVDVRKGALPAVLEQRSMSAASRMRRMLPVGEKLHDITHSQGVRNGLITGGLGAAVSTINVPAALAAVAYAGIEVYKGVNRRTVARRDAVQKTADWARQSISGGVVPSAAEAFATYKDKLEALKPGTHPGELNKFLDRLATHGL